MSTSAPSATGSVPAPTQIATPEATQASLLPDGSWRVDVTDQELIAAGSPVEDAHGGTYTWTFAGTRARINVESTDLGPIECTADAAPAPHGVALQYEDGPCGGGVDTIHWVLAADGLHLGLDAATSGFAANKAWTEAKVWQAVEGQAALDTAAAVAVTMRGGLPGPDRRRGLQSVGFIPGLEMTFADGSWFNTADYPDEIEFDTSDSALRFWQNPGATSETGDLLDDVPRTVDGLTDWFISNPDMVVSDPEEITIGDGIVAKTFTFDVSDTNVNDDPGCPVSVVPERALDQRWPRLRNRHRLRREAVPVRHWQGTDARTVVVSLDTPINSLTRRRRRSTRSSRRWMCPDCAAEWACRERPP